MHHRPKLTWLAFVIMTLGAEAIAVAQTPATAPSPASPPQSANAAPQPSAASRPGPSASTSLKKGSSDVVVNWNSLATRQATAANASNPGLALPGAGGPVAPGAPPSLQGLHGDASAAAVSSAGQPTRVAPPAVADPGAAATSAAAPESVVRDQINPAARTCYASDPDSATRHPGRLILLIKVSDTGAVDSVSVGINSGLSPSLVKCISAAAAAAKFVAPGGAGATVPAAFTFPMR